MKKAMKLKKIHYFFWICARCYIWLTIYNSMTHVISLIGFITVQKAILLGLNIKSNLTHQSNSIFLPFTCIICPLLEYHFWLIAIFLNTPHWTKLTCLLLKPWTHISKNISEHTFFCAPSIKLNWIQLNKQFRGRWDQTEG